MAGEVQLTCSTHKDNVPVLPQPQLAYVLLEIMPTAAVADVQMPLNFAFVLDQSGSMDGEKIANLRGAVKYAIDLLEPGDTISIIAFESTSRVIVPAQPARDKAALKRQVDSLSAGGGTEMARGLREAMSEVRKNLGGNRSSRLVVLTDGQTENEEDCRREADTAARDGIQITALGLGSDWNSKLLADVAERTGGEADYIERPESIGSHFQRAVQSGQGSIIQEAALTLRLLAGISPKKVWRVAPLIADLGVRPLSDRDVQVPLGTLEKDQGQGVLVELLLPPRQEGRYRIAQADISYDIPLLQRSGEHARADIVIGFTSNPALAAQVNTRVMNIIEKVSAFKLQTRALQDVQSGDTAGATQKLRAAATMLVNQGETDLARTMRLEADRLEQGAQMSEDGAKTIQFKGGKTVRLNP